MVSFRNSPAGWKYADWRANIGNLNLDACPRRHDSFGLFRGFCSSLFHGNDKMIWFWYCRFEFSNWWEFFQGLFLKVIVNASPRYQIGVAGSETTGKTLWGFGFSFLYDSILGPLEISFSWGDKTPFNPGAYISRIYFSAGYLL